MNSVSVWLIQWSPDMWQEMSEGSVEMVVVNASCVPSWHRWQLPRNASERIRPANCHWWVIWADIHLILKSLFLCIESLAISPSKKYQEPPLPSLWRCQKCPSPHFFFLFHYGLLQVYYYYYIIYYYPLCYYRYIIEYSSLCCSVEPCCLSILYMLVCIC